MTLPAQSADPVCRYRVGSERANGAELVAALSRLAVELREAERRREREAAGQAEGQGPPMKTPPAPTGAAGNKGYT